MLDICAFIVELLNFFADVTKVWQKLYCKLADRSYIAIYVERIRTKYGKTVSIQSQLILDKRRTTSAVSMSWLLWKHQVQVAMETAGLGQVSMKRYATLCIDILQTQNLFFNTIKKCFQCVFKYYKFITIIGIFIQYIINYFTNKCFDDIDRCSIYLNFLIYCFMFLK